MNRYAQILDGKVHWIFDDELTIDEIYQVKFNPLHIELVNITGMVDIVAGLGYKDGQFYVIDAFNLDEAKVTKLKFVDSQVESHIVNGFQSSASGSKHTYDSQVVDQDNIKLMHQASLSPDFDTDPIYQGQVPIRAIPDGQTDKVILMHNKAQLQLLIDDMARHIGACKMRGWQLQDQVNAATTKEELDVIVW